MKTINKIITNPIFPYDVMVSFNESDKKFIKKIELFKNEINNDILYSFDTSKTDRGMTVIFDGGQLVLRLNFYPKSPEQIGMLAHEIFHVVEFMLRRVNIKLCKKSDEVFAYLIGYYTTEINKLY